MWSSGGASSWPQTLQQFVPDWRTFESPFDNRSYTGVGPFSVSYGFNANLYGINGSQIHYPSQLIVLAGAHNAGAAFAGTSQADVLLPFPLPPNANGASGGTFRNGTQLNALYWDSHVQPILVSTYNDNSSPTGQQQWNPAAALPVP